MRRNDRKIKNFEEIIEVIKKCEIYRPEVSDGKRRISG